MAVREGLASLARLFCYMHHHLVYDGACSDVTHRAFVLCVVGMEKRHLTRDQRCKGWLIPMVRMDPQVEEGQCFRVMQMLQ